MEDNDLLKSKWKVVTHQNNNHDYGIITEELMWCDEDKKFESSFIISSGVISKDMALYMVNIHNNYLDNKQNTLNISNKKWVVEPCFSEKKGEDCWCGTIFTDDLETEIVQYGEISKEIAQHIVDIHNSSLRDQKIHEILE